MDSRKKDVSVLYLTRGDETINLTMGKPLLIRKQNSAEHICYFCQFAFLAASHIARMLSPRIEATL